jgi:DNA-binding transcriptional LysR family regulator
MRRGELADLTAFIAVADNLSFRAAAGRLGVTPSALSHTVRQLEERVGVRLLNRTTRSVSPTDAGRRLLQRLRPAIDEIADALDELNDERTHPFGRLRICTTCFSVAAVIAPVWSRFLSTYPDVHLELVLDGASTDIVARGFDAGIGPRDRIAADMIAVRVMAPMRVAVVGAPGYFAHRPLPRTPDDLRNHDCIQFRRGSHGSVCDWTFGPGGRSRHISVAGRLTVNDPQMCVRAAVDGLGIAYTLEALAEPFLRSGQLVRVLEDWSPCFDGMFLYYPGHRQVPAALRALIDMIRVSSSVPASERPPRENPFATVGRASDAAGEDYAPMPGVPAPRTGKSAPPVIGAGGESPHLMPAGRLVARTPCRCARQNNRA